MIKIKDTQTGDVWRIYDPNETIICSPAHFTIPLKSGSAMRFSDLDKALAWITDQIVLRRSHQESPHPRGFWD